MTDQSEFESLRRDLAARLKHFVAAAHDCEQHFTGLSVPVDVEAYRQFVVKRQAEYDACHAYLSATRVLADFLKEHVQYIQ